MSALVLFNGAVNLNYCPLLSWSILLAFQSSLKGRPEVDLFYHPLTDGVPLDEDDVWLFVAPVASLAKR